MIVRGRAAGSAYKRPRLVSMRGVGCRTCRDTRLIGFPHRRRTSRLDLVLRRVSWGLMGCLVVAAGCMPEPKIWFTSGVPLFTGEIRTVEGWYRFSEGPARDLKGGVYFSDLAGKQIYHWGIDGQVEELREGEPTNGLAVGPDGTLYGCEPYQRRLVRIDKAGKSHVIADAFKGKPFNSCNDLWVDAAGGIYFTDPLYSKDRKRHQGGEYVFYVPKGGAPQLVAEDLVRPNGVVGTPDGKHLYVVDDGDTKTWRYDIEAQGGLTNKTLFVEAGADGMALDAKGRVYLVADEVLIFSPEGKKLVSLDMPFRPTNVAFGGEDRQLLFVTGKWAVYIIGVTAEGAGN